MTAIITMGTRILNAEQMKKSFDNSSNDKNYLFIGKPTPWVDDNIPMEPSDSSKSDTDVRRDILAMQRISESDVSLGILRRDWTLGRYYDFYRSDYGESGVTGINLEDGNATTPNSLDEANYYVVTDEFNVYMCMWNGNGAPSTIKPTGRSTSIISTADGYQWKYMYTVAASDILKFVSTSFIPIKRVESNPGVSSQYYDQWEVRAAAVPGTINRILVKNGGSGYPSSSTFPITVIGDGVGCTATASTNSSGSVSSVTITAIGSGYTWANVSISGGTGAEFFIITSPRGGYGFDPISQLNARYTLIGVQLPHESGDFPSANEYRRLGVIRSPLNYGTGTIANASTLNANRIINMALGITGVFSADEIVTGMTSGATGTVVDSNSTQVRIVQIGNQRGTFSVGETVVGSSSGASGAVSSITLPEVDASTGDLVYLEHRRPVSRQPDQIETVKIIIES